MPDGYELSSLTEVEAVLDSLDPATSEQVYLQTRDMSSRAVAAVAASRADSAGGASFPDEWTIGAGGELDVPILTVSGDGTTDYSLIADGGANNGKIAQFRTDDAKLVATFTEATPNFSPGADHSTLEVTRNDCYINLQSGTGEFVISDYDGNSAFSVLPTGGVTIQPSPGSTDNPFFVHKEDGSAIMLMLASGLILMPTLPTVDPASSGTLWNSAGTLKVSAG